MFGRFSRASALLVGLVLATAALLIVSAFGPGRAYAAEASPPAGQAWAWGKNDSGQVGDGTTTDRTIPVQISGLGDTVDVSGGYLHSLALKANGTVWAWGNNDRGQLGDGTTTSHNNPVQVSDLSNIVDVDAGGRHSLALKADGTVWAWGFNYTGQLGDGTTTNRKTPVQVSGLSNIVDVEDGAYYSLALKADGTVWAWGSNFDGELGDGTTTDRHTPVQVSGLTGVKTVVGGDAHTVAVKGDGTVWAWGLNNAGAVDESLSSGRFTTPVQVGGLSNVVDVSAGYSHSVAVKSDGTVWAWGYDAYGQLGNGTTAPNSDAPVQVSRLTEVETVAAAGDHTLAVEGDGTVWAWGANWDGALGDGTTTDRSTPVQVSVLKNATDVEAGFDFSMAVAEAETTPPKVNSTAPAADATGASPSANVTATFSEKMQKATVTKSTFKLFKVTSTGTTQVTNVTVSLSSDGLKATLNPFGTSTTKLAKNAKYKAVVTTGARDLAGNALDQNRSLSGNQAKSWTFTVRR